MNPIPTAANPIPTAANPIPTATQPKRVNRSSILNDDKDKSDNDESAPEPAHEVAPDEYIYIDEDISAIEKMLTEDDKSPITTARAPTPSTPSAEADDYEGWNSDDDENLWQFRDVSTPPREPNPERPEPVCIDLTGDDDDDMDMVNRHPKVRRAGGSKVRRADGSKMTLRRLCAMRPYLPFNVSWIIRRCIRRSINKNKKATASQLNKIEISKPTQ
jgi:hypothetical protein